MIQQTGILIQHTERGRHERWLAVARQALSEDLAAAAWAEGQQMGLDHAIAYAMAPYEPFGGTAEATAAPPTARISGPLTPRQSEVAALIAQGLTNRQIAECLVVSERAAAAHVGNILNRSGSTLGRR